ncbi:ribonuclease HII [Pseudohongiella sp.]|uniref:Ribonuclease HII n=1 Tax=marine sediment metagenome TaxID=412755 RepID=A0A0F9Z422_9ZZZZ|nr:ribonuclease HII [Pseudohongiella sp.]HDZ08506.1 ribonuclease HII [Pseudohongiella sp.]HEA61756.1 ribonuclease HII [Pseudohongiella sp.]
MQRATELVAQLRAEPGRVHKPGQAIAGVDEAGRGPLAGEVYAAAVILPESYHLPGLNDSKKLSARRREQLFELICEQAVSYTIVGLAASEIDRINIFQATLQAMKKAVTTLATQPDFVYVDGTHCPSWSYASEALVKGDSRLDCIAAASVLAKVTRDRVMTDLDQQYPGYGFAQHKGYPTKMHMAALQQLGPCPEHRRSYAPVARCIAALSEKAQ